LNNIKMKDPLSVYSSNNYTMYVHPWIPKYFFYS
jgi:hypothetical protein